MQNILFINFYWFVIWFCILTEPRKYTTNQIHYNINNVKSKIYLLFYMSPLIHTNKYKVYQRMHISLESKSSSPVALLVRLYMTTKQLNRYPNIWKCSMDDFDAWMQRILSRSMQLEITHRVARVAEHSD